MAVTARDGDDSNSNKMKMKDANVYIIISYYHEKLCRGSHGCSLRVALRGLS